MQMRLLVLFQSPNPLQYSATYINTQLKCTLNLHLIWTKKNNIWELNMVLFFDDLVLILLIKFVIIYISRHRVYRGEWFVNLSHVILHNSCISLVHCTMYISLTQGYKNSCCLILNELNWYCFKDVIGYFFVVFISFN